MILPVEWRVGTKLSVGLIIFQLLEEIRFAFETNGRRSVNNEAILKLRCLSALVFTELELFPLTQMIYSSVSTRFSQSEMFIFLDNYDLTI